MRKIMVLVLGVVLLNACAANIHQTGPPPKEETIVEIVRPVAPPKVYVIEPEGTDGAECIIRAKLLFEHVTTTPGANYVHHARSAQVQKTGDGRVICSSGEVGGSVRGNSEDVPQIHVPQMQEIHPSSYRGYDERRGTIRSWGWHKGGR